MAKGELIDDHVSARQCKLAVNALLDHAVKAQEKKVESELLPGKEQNVWLVVTVKQMQPEKKLKPFKIPIAHPLVDPRTSSICLITKDPQREYKDLLESHKIRFISRVVGIAKLKGKFKPYEARRLLLKENDLFLADERVVPLLPNLLGRKFFQAKKQPIPVCLTRKDLKGELERAISSTYFHQNQGTCTSVKIGTVSQNPSQVLDNLKIALPAVVKHIKGEWDNVQSFHIKTNSSGSLPIWSCNLGTEEGARWDGLTAEVSSEEESEKEGSADESEVRAEEAQVVKTGKKRSSKQPLSKTKKAEADKILVDEHAAEVPKGKGKKRMAEEEAGKPQKKVKADRSHRDRTRDSVEGVAKGEQKAQAAALVSSVTDIPTKRSKKRKASAVERTPSDTIPSDAASMNSGKPSASHDGDASLPQATPPTPSASKKTKPRAAAMDFFEDVPSSATPPVPPNTPADGLGAPSSTKKKRKAKAANLTPLNNILAKLADEPAVEKSITESQKSAASEPTDALSSTPLTKKVKKRKARTTDAPAIVTVVPVPAVSAATVVKEDLKKKRVTEGGEKKKEKVVHRAPGAKSAKHAIVGKKRRL